jgi:bacillithiol system protein YtxJ
MPLTWNTLDSESALETLVKHSFDTPQLIFKHSTRCNISALAKYRLEDDWSLEGVEPHYLDLLQHRPLSAAIAERFSVHHESPQVLLIVNGECVYDASHLDITVAEIAETLDALNARQDA